MRPVPEPPERAGTIEAAVVPIEACAVASAAAPTGLFATTTTPIVLEPVGNCLTLTKRPLVLSP